MKNVSKVTQRIWGFFFKGEDRAIDLDSGIEVGLVFTNWSEKSDCGYIRSNGEPV